MTHNMREVYIIAATRTPIGGFGGQLSSLSATELGGFAIRSAIEKSGITDLSLISEVLMGNVLSSNLGQAPARQTALKAGLSISTPCTTINKVCASGMKAVMLGAQAIMCGQAEIVVAGGMESMSNVPYYLPKARFGYKYGDGNLVDGLQKDGLQVKGRRGEKNLISEDEDFKKVNFEKIPTLKPVFLLEGTVTAANASNISDGASALILADKKTAMSMNLPIIGKIRGFSDAASDPLWFTTAPSLAIPKALKIAGVNSSDIDYYEINEAFAAVALANQELLSIPEKKLNVYGGAVALGHPLGCSGSRIITTLLSILHQENGNLGVAGICNGGGGASAIVIEKM